MRTAVANVIYWIRCMFTFNVFQLYGGKFCGICRSHASRPHDWPFADFHKGKTDQFLCRPQIDLNKRFFIIPILNAQKLTSVVNTTGTFVHFLWKCTSLSLENSLIISDLVPLLEIPEVTTNFLSSYRTPCITTFSNILHKHITYGYILSAGIKHP